MSRYVLAYEDRTTVDGRRLEPGAAWWDPARLPLPVQSLAEPGVPSKVLAHITAIERSADVIWAVVDEDLSEGLVLALDGAGAEMDWIDGEPPHGVWLFRQIEVVAATIIPSDRWAWRES